MGKEDLVLIESTPGQSIVLYYITDAGQGLAHGGVGAVYNVANTFISLSNEETEILYTRMQDLNKGLSKERPYLIRPNPVWFEDSIDIERLGDKDIIRYQQELKQPVKQTALLANPIAAPTTWVGSITRVVGEHGVYFVLGRVTGCATLFSSIGAFMSQPGGMVEKGAAAITVGGLEKFTHSALHKFGAHPSIIRDMFTHGAIHEGTHHLIEHISGTHEDSLHEEFSANSPNLLVGRLPEQMLSGTTSSPEWQFYPVYPGSKTTFLPDPSYDLFSGRDLREELQGRSFQVGSDVTAAHGRVSGDTSVAIPGSTFVPQSRPAPDKASGSFLDGAKLVLSGGTSTGVVVGVELGLSWAAFFTLGAGFVVGVGIIKYIGYRQKKNLKKLKSKLKKISHRDEEIQAKCNEVNDLFDAAAKRDPGSEDYRRIQADILSHVSAIIRQCEDQLSDVDKVKEKHKKEYKKHKGDYKASKEVWRSLESELRPIGEHARLESIPLHEMRINIDRHKGKHQHPAIVQLTERYLDRSYREAIFAVRSNNLPQAAKLCDEALTLDPENRDLILLKAHMLLQSSDGKSEALQILLTSEAKNPDGSAEKIGLLRYYLMASDTDQAFGILTHLQAMPLGVEEQEIVSGLEKATYSQVTAQSISLLHQGKINDAFDLMQNPVYHMPASQLKLLEGLSACQRGTLQEGLALLQQAKDLDPNDEKIALFFDYAKQRSAHPEGTEDALSHQLSDAVILGVFGKMEELQEGKQPVGDGCVIS